MANTITIKPEFFLDDHIAELSPLERLAFIGLWTIADDKGCLAFRPRRLKAQILPYDECDFEGILNHLKSYGLISFCHGEVGSDFHIQIFDFDEGNQAFL